MRVTLSLACWFVAALPGCGGSTGAPAAPVASAETVPTTEAPASAAPDAAAASKEPGQAPAEAPAEAKEAPAAPAAWSASLTKEQKAAFMKQTVMPRMSKVFQAADPARYASFTCKTCHGPDFKDPDDFLPPLTLKNDQLTAFAEKPAVAKFMAEKVVPEMANILGQSPYDPKTHQGFGCAGCHAIAKK